ncbi:hypothetical protein WJX74_007598 [Apatococcus lobatus]|uniref:Proteasome subunit beta n=1 Tax=Apatococcus lobatus TaxID=904363 RepID=A0AAW1RZ27_9CHLO
MTDSSGDWTGLQAPATGTTIVAVTFDGGVVLGADSRVSTGTYVSNRASDKIAQLSDQVYLLRSGSAADTQLVSDYVRYFAEQHAIGLSEPPSVKTIANLVKQMNYQNKQMLEGAMIIAGWDREGGGQVYGCPIGGTLLQEPWTTDGSGSTYIWGYLDSAFRHHMTQDEAEELVITSISLAMARDGSSGGVVRLITLSKDGARRRLVKGDEVQLYGEELQMQSSSMDLL